MRLSFVLSGVATGIRRNAAMTIALILSTSIALAFVGAAVLANTEITNFKRVYESKINVSVYLCAQPLQPAQPPCTHRTTDAETAAIRTKLDKDPMVSSFSYVSEQEAFERGKAQQGPAVAKFIKLGDLPASFTVHLKDLKRDYQPFAKEYKGVQGVGQVNNQYKTIKTLLDVIDGARWFSIIIAVVVLVASVLLIGNTIQVAAAQRRNETGIMRLVGASRWMTELPFMLEAIFATIVGGLIAIGLVSLGKHYVLDGVFKVPTENGVIPNLDTSDVLVAGGIGLALGVVLSAITAFVTLRLYVRL
jgi:cell division transport system permease protein